MNIASMEVKKPSKKRAFKVVKLLERSEFVDGAHKKLLAELYKYFIPPKPAKPKTAEQWVSKAVAVNDVRYYLKYTKVENGQIIGTDGNRIHIAPTELPDGAYDSALTLIDPHHAGVFPKNWKALTDISRHNSAKFEDLTLETYEKNTLWGYKLSTLDTHIARFDKKLMDQALSYLDNPTVYYTGVNDRIVMIDGLKTAVLMPINV